MKSANAKPNGRGWRRGSRSRSRVVRSPESRSPESRSQPYNENAPNGYRWAHSHCATDLKTQDSATTRLRDSGLHDSGLRDSATVLRPGERASGDCCLDGLLIDGGGERQRAATGLAAHEQRVLIRLDGRG